MTSSAAGLRPFEEAEDFRRDMELRRREHFQRFGDRTFRAVRLPAFGGLHGFIVLDTDRLKSARHKSAETGDVFPIADEISIPLSNGHDWKISSLQPLHLEVLDEEQTVDNMMLGLTLGLSFIDDHAPHRTYISPTQQKRIIPTVIPIIHPHDVQRMIQQKLRVATLLAESHEISLKMAALSHRSNMKEEAQLAELRVLHRERQLVESSLAKIEEKLVQELRQRSFLRQSSSDRDLSMLMKKTRQLPVRKRWHESN